MLRVLLWLWLVAAATFVLPAQLVLTGTNYFQSFNTIAGGLPDGWAVRTNATTTSLGTVVTFPTAAKSWGDPTGEFGNFASLTNNAGSLATGGESAATQAAFTNRMVGVRQTGTFGDPGAAFVLQLTNTLGFSNFVFSAQLYLLRSNANSTTWTIQYAVGNSPVSFTTLGTFVDPGSVGVTPVSYNLGADANDQAQNVWIRVAALTATGSSATRDSFGLDNVSLGYAGPSAPDISSQPASRTNAVYTTATFSVGLSGVPPFSYQWYKGASPLSNGGNIAGATNATLTLSQVIHADAGAYSVVVTNNSGSVTSTVANLTVIGFAIAPVLPTNTLAGTPVTVPLAFIDTVSVSSAAGSSSNQVILPNANISAAAAGSSGSATLTPVAGTGGVVLTSLTASDGSFSTNTVFSLLVVPSTNVVFNDQFDYVNGPVTAGSIGLWANHSGPAGQLAVSNGALRVSASFDEDASVALLGQPYTTTSPAVLYSRFILNVKSPTDLPGVVGNYFAHFRGAASTSQRARVWISTTNAAAGKFRLGIGNGSASSNLTAQVEQDLEPGTNYVVITRLVVSNAVSSIWINPASETDTNSLLFDTAEDVPTTTSDIIAYAFRQESTGGSTSEGNITVDNLVVGTSFAAVAGSNIPTPVPLAITTAAGKAIVSWTDGSGLFKLATGTNVLQVTNIISGATSPYTNGISGSQTYFRLVYP